MPLGNFFVMEREVLLPTPFHASNLKISIRDGNKKTRLRDPFPQITRTEKMEKILSRGEIVEEVKKQLWLALPLMVVSVLQFSLVMISSMFVGHLGELPLAGASMATSFAVVTGYSLLMGMGSALDTLCGQAYGAKQYYMVGIHMQRAMVVLLLVSIPLACIWAFTDPILLSLRQDPKISAEAGIFARWMIPSIFAYAILQCLIRFLQTQRIILPMMISSGITTLLHILVCWLMVFEFRVGIKGPALALVISYWFNVLLLALYVKFSPACKMTWTGFSIEALHNPMRFVGLAVPSAIMVCLECWSFDLLVILSGLLPNPELETSVISICLNTASMLFMVPFSLGNTISTRVSNELGAGRPQVARLAVCVMACLVVTLCTILELTIISVRNIWGHAYSNEKDVIKYVARMMPLIAISNFLEGIQSVLSGTTRGCGLQKIGAFINLGAYYLAGVPCAILLAFIFHMRGKGLWIGIICGLSVQSLLLLLITLRTNWEQQANKAKDRVKNYSIPLAATSCTSPVSNPA